MDEYRVVGVKSEHIVKAGDVTIATKTKNAAPPPPCDENDIAAGLRPPNCLRLLTATPAPAPSVTAAAAAADDLSGEAIVFL